jgi:predicted Zn-dependent peptidase
MMELGSASTVQLDERVYRTEIPNGPIVVSEEVPAVRSAAAGVWVRWGAGHDVPERMGASHLLEHMIFKGTQSRTAHEIALEIEGIGGDEHLPMAVDVLTDLVFRPLLRQSDLEIERNVILEEIAGVEDAPEELVFDLHARAVWGDHPYGSPVLGTAETVGSITREDLQRLWQTAYRPDVCVVAAAGKLQHDQVLELVAEHFPADGQPGRPPTVAEPTTTVPEEGRYPRDSAQVHICMGAPTFPRRDPRRYASILISTALGGGMSSRLFQRLREELGLAYTIYTYQSFYARGGLAGVYMATRPDTADRAVDEVRTELARLSGTGLASEELSAIKNQTKGQVILSLESTSARLQRLAGVALYDEPYQTLDEICARIDAVSVDEVAALCRKYYAPESQAVVRLGPEVEGA